VDVSRLLHLTVDFLSKDPALSRVRVDVEGTAPPVSADAEFLKIVFQNLLLNAAQAMRGEGKIRVSISSTNGACRITIADAGPGISPEAREKLFRPFFTTKARGTGLGLVTAKRLVEAHGGTIRIDSPPEGGTMVTVDLPQARASDPR
jgi:signal transduction histidine kinase